MTGFVTSQIQYRGEIEARLLWQNTPFDNITDIDGFDFVILIRKNGSVDLNTSEKEERKFKFSQREWECCVLDILPIKNKYGIF